MTLTLGHSLEMPLADLKRLLLESSRRARQGRDWMNIKETGKILGVVQGVEVLHSRITGWHPHLHLLVVGLGGAKAVEAAAKLFRDRYMKEVARRGGKAEMIGQDVKLVRDDKTRELVAWYASKGSAAWEVAGGLKDARGEKSRTPWQLAQLAAAGDDGAKALFLEYAEAMPGTRSCVVSPALARALEIDPDEDEDAPGDEQQLDEKDSAVGELPSMIWKRVLGRGVAWRVLHAVEQHLAWTEVENIARRLGADDPPPLRTTPLDVRRAVVEARAQGGVASNAAASRYLAAAVERQRAEVACRGRVLVVTEENTRAAEREFIMSGLAAVM